MKHLKFFFTLLVYIIAVDDANPFDTDACPKLEKPICSDSNPDLPLVYWSQITFCPWASLSADVQAALFVIGFSEKVWPPMADDPPISLTLCWNQLSNQATKVLDETLCWDEEKWNTYFGCACVDRDDIIEDLGSFMKNNPLQYCAWIADNTTQAEQERFCESEVEDAFVALGMPPATISRTGWDVAGLKIKDFCRVTCEDCQFECAQPNCGKINYFDVVKSFWNSASDRCEWSDLPDDMRSKLETLGQSEDLWELVRTDVAEESEEEIIGENELADEEGVYEGAYEYYFPEDVDWNERSSGSILDLTLCWFQLEPAQRAAAQDMCFDFRSWDFDVLCACVDRDDLLKDITKDLPTPLEDCAMEIGYHPTFDAPPRRLAGKCDQPLTQTLQELGAADWMISRDISDMNLTHVCPVSCGGCPTTCDRPICEDYKPIVVESRWQTYRENCKWDDIKDVSLLSLLKNLGWTEESWQVRHFPWQMTLCYSQLSTEMKEIAAELCYTQESWEAPCLCVDRDDFLEHITKGSKREVKDCKNDLVWNEEDFDFETVCDMTISDALHTLGTKPILDWDLDTFKVKEFCPASCRQCKHNFLCSRPDCSKMEWSPIVNSFWQTFLEDCSWREISVESQADLNMLGWDESRWDQIALSAERIHPISMSLCWDQLGHDMIDAARNFCFDAQSWDTLVKCRNCADRDDIIAHVTADTSSPLADCASPNEDGLGFYGSDCEYPLEEVVSDLYESDDVNQLSEDLKLFGRQKVRNFCKVSCETECKANCDRPICSDFDTPELAEDYWETFRNGCMWHEISLNMKVEMIVMGWTEDNWGMYAPEFANLCWGQMTSEQHMVLSNLCFNEYTWNKFVKCECMDLSQEICDTIKNYGDYGRSQCGKSAQEVTGLDDVKGLMEDHCPHFCDICYQPVVTTNGPEIRERIITETKIVTQRQYLNSGYKTPAIAAVTILFALLVLWIYCQNFGSFEVRRKFDPNIEPDTPQFGNLQQQADEVELA